MPSGREAYEENFRAIGSAAEEEAEISEGQRKCNGGKIHYQETSVAEKFLPLRRRFRVENQEVYNTQRDEKNEEENGNPQRGAVRLLEQLDI